MASMKLRSTTTRYKSSEYDRERSLAWGKANPAKARRKAKNWRLKNAEHVRAKARAAYAADPSYMLNACKVSRLRKQELEAGRKKPKRCELCRKSSSKMCFDHCHKTTKFRGWLCTSCNTVLGLVNDSPKLLRKLALYVEQKGIV